MMIIKSYLIPLTQNNLLTFKFIHIKVRHNTLIKTKANTDLKKEECKQKYIH